MYWRLGGEEEGRGREICQGAVATKQAKGDGAGTKGVAV